MPARHHIILQGNLNHCARAQDLLVQAMAEWGVAVAAVAEPYFVPPRGNWAGDREETVAIVASTAGHSPPLVVKERGSGFVAARWGEVILIGVYFSPNRTLAQFQAFLETLERAVRRAAPTPVLVLGDFNAKSAAWGSPVTNTRGPELENWAAVLGLAILNRGHANTCVRRNGGSIVDVTFATPSLAARVSGWQVLEDEETLSDHKYIRMRVSHTPPTTASNTAPGGGFPKWALTRLDLELAEEAAMVQAWCPSPTGHRRRGAEGGQVQGRLDCRLRAGHAQGQRDPGQIECVLVDRGDWGPPHRQYHGPAGLRPMPPQAPHPK
ncbi:uncharacterized protein LOC113239056 [Hyposmocoma kahamanoa]|uniref:uncharacterized protein LOC113239056 n=2 Tax=Hyposmocoma kahamanoa TaxID=1477025 RepID=UPI000E6D9CF5|nr:uncharacterized protein LOC113239056 [Hyposmocoma kahamanoa]